MTENTPIFMHINYTEADYPIDEAFAFARAAGFDGIELRDRDRSGRTGLSEYLERTALLSERHRLPIIYGCRVDTTHACATVREASFAHFLEVLHFSAAHGGTLVNAFGGLLPKGSDTGSPQPWENHLPETARVFQEAAAVAAGLGIRICLETHFGYLHDLAGHSLRVIEAIGAPGVLVNLDFTNIYLTRGGEPMNEAVEQLGGHIGYVHLKNALKLRRSSEDAFLITPLAAGDVNHRVLLKRLAGQGYRGPLCLENTMRGDKYQVAREDLAYLRSLLCQLDAPSPHLLQP